MSAAFSKRALTLGLLVVYLAATTFGSLLHVHSQHEGEHVGHAQHLGDHDAHERPDCAAGFRTAGGTLHDDDCAACRFAGHRSLGVQAPAAECSSQLSIPLVIVHDTGAISTLSRTTHSRAPPLPC